MLSAMLVGILVSSLFDSVMEETLFEEYTALLHPEKTLVHINTMPIKPFLFALCKHDTII